MLSSCTQQLRQQLASRVGEAASAQGCTSAGQDSSTTPQGPAQVSSHLLMLGKGGLPAATALVVHEKANQSSKQHKKHQRDFETLETTKELQMKRKKEGSSFQSPSALEL